LAKRLSKAGFQVWYPEDRIAPGGNWAKEIGRALDDSEFMVILLTPRSMESDWLRQEIEFAISSKKYEGRLFTLFVGPATDVEKNVPWILLELPHLQIESAKGLGDSVKRIRTLRANPTVSHLNA
jgi:hypothetical protein